MARIFVAVSMFSFILLCASSLFAADLRPLSGGAGGSLGGGGYLVKAVLTVPVGDTLRVGAGAALYFEQLTGIDVRGVLEVGGTPESPVVMTSSSDTAGAAGASEAFFWNGVRTFGAAAAVFMSHVAVSNSVYGVNVGDTLSRAEFVEVAFKNNGYAPLVRGAEIVPVSADAPVTVSWNAEVPSQPKKPVKKAAKKPVGSKERGVDVKFIVNASALTVAAAGLTTCYIGLSNTSTYYEHYVPEGKSGKHSAYYEGKIRKNITVSAVGAVVAGVGLTCMGLTLFF